MGTALAVRADITATTAARRAIDFTNSLLM
jgi:hypothetical protein